ncbi:hypothetical protein GH714_003869 [Hevea brasiliensis]|uniref:SAP30-binding protein n=1 Tax=Hevea brasiliensis TaxID=3981 RepID=A0A6A6M770_HEVBR|nr:hypothetical protein GH714_003869 [Hevea brasiliensis]
MMKIWKISMTSNKEQQQQHEEDELLEDQNDYRESNETGPDSVNDAMVTDDLPNETSEHLETSQPIEMNNTVIESEAVENEGTTNVLAEDDSLDKFLPPPSKDKCPEELQRKIDKFLALKKVGRSFNAEVRNRKDYRNPDFLLHAVRYQDIDQIGSCFSKDVFDPHGYDKSDFYDEIEADMRREKERKEQELKKSPKVEFISGGTQVAPHQSLACLFQVQKPSSVNVVDDFNFTIAAPSGLHSASTTADAVVRDGRQNKKSKWDKVDGDGKNLLPTGGQDSLTTVAAHAALLSAANVGAGYTAFVQQKRREAEEKRSSEKKLERRS